MESKYSIIRKQHVIDIDTGETDGYECYETVSDAVIMKNKKTLQQTIDEFVDSTKEAPPVLAISISSAVNGRIYLPDIGDHKAKINELVVKVTSSSSERVINSASLFVNGIEVQTLCYTDNEGIHSSCDSIDTISENYMVAHIKDIDIAGDSVISLEVIDSLRETRTDEVSVKLLPLVYYGVVQKAKDDISIDDIDHTIPLLTPRDDIDFLATVENGCIIFAVTQDYEVDSILDGNSLNIMKSFRKITGAFGNIVYDMYISNQVTVEEFAIKLVVSNKEEV